MMLIDDLQEKLTKLEGRIDKLDEQRKRAELLAPEIDETYEKLEKIYPKARSNKNFGMEELSKLKKDIEVNKKILTNAKDKIGEMYSIGQNLQKICKEIRESVDGSTKAIETLSSQAKSLDFEKSRKEMKTVLDEIKGYEKKLTAVTKKSRIGTSKEI